MPSSQEHKHASVHPNPWDSDILGRQEYAEFLTRYLKQKTLAGDGQGRASFTMAIDAQWGQGKTFFVTNWSMTLARSGYPTMVFDAWKADYAADPVVAFMAEFKSALDEKIKSAGCARSVKERADELMRSALRGIRRALLPAGKQIAKSLLHKTTGIATDEIIDAFGRDQKPIKQDSDAALFKDGLEIVNKGLDEFFDKALEEHGERKQAIDEFRLSVEMTLKELVSSGAVSLPMFVFIDELDRCRPNFAIALLEGVKHLFGIPGVCFVVSTNTSQLSHSIRAIYGEGFDGYGYLKRFFDVESSLPESDGSAYIAMLLKSYPEFENRRLVLGVPQNGFKGLPQVHPHDVMAWVAEAFSINLRSQRTFVEMVAAAMTGIPEHKPVFLLWLAAVCAIKIKSSDAFSTLSQKRIDPESQLAESFKQAGFSEKRKRSYLVPQGYNTVERTVSMIEAVEVYFMKSNEDLIKIRDDFYQDPNRGNYPRNLILDIANEAPDSYQEKTPYPSSLSGYLNLVKSAGYLSAM